MRDIEQQSIDRYCFRSLRIKCARNSFRLSCNRKNFQASRLTELVTLWKIEICYWKNDLISSIDLFQSIKDRQVIYMCVKSLVYYAELKDALASKIGKIVRTRAVYFQSKHLDAVPSRYRRPGCRRYGHKEDVWCCPEYIDIRGLLRYARVSALVVINFIREPLL